MRVTIIGANGFVGTGLRNFLAEQPGLQLSLVTRQNYESLKGANSDITIDASGNSKKYLSDQNPLLDLDLTVAHRLRTLQDFPASLHLHISSVDVYHDLASPATTREDTPINPAASSNYGLHKSLAEQVVQHYARSWLIVRLAGMVGPALRKNPVFDILNGLPLRIHPNSQYQFMSTTEVARILWQLAQTNIRGQIFNVCGDGLISPRAIAALSGKEPDLSLLPPNAAPRIVDVNIEKLKGFTSVQKTAEVMARFVKQYSPAAP